MTAGTGLLLAGMWFASATHGESDDLRNRLAQFVAAADARAAASDHRHDAPWGATTDAAAFSHYRRATDEPCTRSLLWFRWNVRQDRGRETPGAENDLTPERLLALREHWAPAIEELCRGAHARDRRPQPGSSSSGIVEIAQAEVAARWHEGRRADSASLWLDLLTFCVDMQDRLIGDQTCESIDFWTDTRLHELVPAERQRLADALERLDSRFAPRPDARQVVAANVHLRELLQPGQHADWSLQQRLRAWGFGFDPVARGLAGMWALADRANELDDPALASARGRARWLHLLAQPMPGSTAVHDHAVWWLRTTEAQRCSALASLRLLRHALAVHLDDPPPGFTDPFSDAPFQLAIDDVTTTFRSEGGLSRRVTRTRR